MSNVALGLSIFSSRYSRFDNYGIVWAYLGFLGYVIGSMVVIHIIQTICRFKNGNRSWVVLHDGKEKVSIISKKDEDLSKYGTSDGTSDEDRSSNKNYHSYGSWIGCAIFVGYSLVLVLAISVIIALPRRAS